MSKVFPETEYVSFRFVNDDGSESAATWAEDLNTNTTINVDSGDVELRLRILYKENNGEADTIYPSFMVSKNGGGLVLLSGSTSGIYPFDSTYLTDNADTTQRLGSGTFQSTNGQQVENGSNNAVTINAQECETEFTFKIVASEVVDGDYFTVTPRQSSTAPFDVVTGSNPVITIESDNTSIDAGHADLYINDHNISPYIQRGILADPTEVYFHRFCSQPSGVTAIINTGGWAVSSVTCAANVTAAGHIQYTIDGTWNDEQYTETWYNLGISGVADYFRIGVRVVDGVTDYTGYVLECNEFALPATFRLYRYDDGTKTELDSANSFTSNSGVFVSIKVEGTTIKTYLNGVEQHSVTDSTYSSGRPSFGIQSASGSTPTIKYVLAESKVAAGGGDTEITADVDVLTLTDFNTDINAETSFTTSVDELTLTDYNTTVSFDIDIQSDVDVLTLTKFNTTVKADTSFTAGLNALTLTSYNATIFVGSNVEIDAGVDVLTLTDNNVELNIATNLTATLDELILTSHNATVTTQADTEIDAGIDVLTLTEYNADINAEINIDANGVALSLTDYSVDINAETSIDAGVDALTLTSHNATVSTGLVIGATVDVLTLTSYNTTVEALVDVDVDAGVDSLTLTSYSASISVATEITAGVDELVLTEHQATVTVDTAITASKDDLVLTEFPVTLTFDKNIDAGTDSLTLTAYASTVLFGDSSSTYETITGVQMIATSDDTAFPLEIAVDDSGGVTGLAVTVSIRDIGDSSSYLDFDDLTFKTSGWVTKAETTTEIGNGFYGITLDISSITNLPTGKHLSLEYDISGTVVAVDSQILTIEDGISSSDHWQYEIEGSVSAEKLMRMMSAVLAGKASGLDTLNPTFRDVNDSRNAVVAVTDEHGNRSSVTINEA